MPTLTQAQLTALKTDIAANVNTVLNPTTGQTVAINTIPHDDGGGANAIATWYNGFPGTTFFANYFNVPLATLKAAIKHKNYTPTDSVPANGTTTTITNNQLFYMNELMVAASFQAAVNILMTGGGTTFDATNTNLVSALQDATSSNMPTGTGGASLNGGWGTTVKPAICRAASNAEKLFADTSGANGSTNLLAARLVYDSGRDGILTGTDIVNAWTLG